MAHFQQTVTWVGLKLNGAGVNRGGGVTKGCRVIKEGGVTGGGGVTRVEWELDIFSITGTGV